MLTKEIIQNAVLLAHGGNNTIIETDDFLSGAWFAVQALREAKMIEVDTTLSYKEAGDLIEKEHKENYRAVMALNDILNEKA